MENITNLQVAFFTEYFDLDMCGMEATDEVQSATYLKYEDGEAYYTLVLRNLADGSVHSVTAHVYYEEQTQSVQVEY